MFTLFRQEFELRRHTYTNYITVETRMENGNIRVRAEDAKQMKNRLDLMGGDRPGRQYVRHMVTTFWERLFSNHWTGRG